MSEKTIIYSAFAVYTEKHEDYIETKLELEPELLRSRKYRIQGAS